MTNGTTTQIRTSFYVNSEITANEIKTKFVELTKLNCELYFYNKFTESVMQVNLTDDCENIKY